MRRLKDLTVGIVVLVVVICGGLSSAMASSLTCYQGNFAADNTIVTQNINVAAGWYLFQTWSYAGTASGHDPCGNVVSVNNGVVETPRGGFDTILSLFTGAGINLIAYNDDGYRLTDPSTGQAWDSTIKIYLPTGNYTVALTEYNNFPAGYTGALPGPGLGAGFIEDGNATFTAGFEPATLCPLRMFCDVSGTTGAQRTALYDFSYQPIPEPSSLLLLGSGIIGLAGVLRRRINL